MARSSQKKIERYARWLDTPEEERLPHTQRELAEELGVTQKTICDWKNKIKASSDGDEVGKWLAYVKKQAYRPGSNYRWGEMYQSLLKMAGTLTDQSGKRLTDDIDTGQVLRLLKQADAELKSGDNGNVEVPKKPEILFDELRFHSEQEHGQDN